MQRNLSQSLTTKEQRHQLFSLWQESGNIHAACKEAGLSRSTFYYWKPRFLDGGYDALNELKSHAPINPRRIPQEIEQEIITLKKDNPAWGKSRIAKTIRARTMAETISPNTVRRVLIDAGLWGAEETKLS